MILEPSEEMSIANPPGWTAPSGGTSFLALNHAGSPRAPGSSPKDSAKHSSAPSRSKATPANC